MLGIKQSTAAEYTVIPRQLANQATVNSKCTPILSSQNIKERRGPDSKESSRPNRRQYIRNGWNQETVVKQLNRFLQCERLETTEIKRPPYSKQELAQLLGTSVNEIDKILHRRTTVGPIISKVILSLAKLFCSVKFSDQG